MRIRKENPEKAPNFGYCAAQDQIYFGYKPHGIRTVNGVITSVMSSKLYWVVILIL